ncbi:MAG: tyrosine-protein phosphatase [Polyangiaceae bacterium]|nr:tyrosine-protein phosphatase [Polyangiaceae bacterium]
MRRVTHVGVESFGIGGARSLRAWVLASLTSAGLVLFGCSGATESPRSANAAGTSGAGLGVAGDDGTGGPTGAEGGPVDLGSAVVNARQLGGIVTESGQRVRANVLIRAGELSQVDCARLRALEIATVVDLRDAADAAGTPDAACVSDETRYYLADLPKILPPNADSYLQTLDAMEPKLDAVFAELGRDGALPAVVHCVIGRDRASLTMALVLLALGVPVAAVERDFVENQTTAGSTSAEWMSGVFARIDAAGRIDAYLAAHGVTADDVAGLRTQALE